ncbi:hypothetical protein SAMN04487818_101561 [Actinokineospora terrae]|uniref:Uncharacterized protein n=1 Tax=Actinokineospora terrae TaxID=155974 RepID=A0A1H9LDB2_9PSEU|nr:hypothetical protein SAMN04487818_101561 [Actinokineospora terrae]
MRTRSVRPSGQLYRAIALLPAIRAVAAELDDVPATAESPVTAIDAILAEALAKLRARREG